MRGLYKKQVFSIVCFRWFILFRRFIINYIEKNRKVILATVIFLVIGICIGIIGYLFMNEPVRLELNDYVRSSFELSNSDGYQKISIIINGVKSNLLFVFILVLAAITIIGIPIIYIMYIVKGIAIGIYCCIIFSIFNFWNAILCFVMLNIVVNMVYIPAIIYIGVNLLRFNNKLIENIKEGKLVKMATLEMVKLFARIFSYIF